MRNGIDIITQLSYNDKTTFPNFLRDVHSVIDNILQQANIL